ncbi:Nif3-like dinuclear metal center hexameric protein, partial [Francisella tularensis subsp. holarctica]|uniref:Nif3-like dinuclear metal center hexameric protein n=1 Tax=Francisella tularensis TaxID=263 RepID=UPI002381D138
MYFKDLEQSLSTYFAIEQFKDYCPNGLQVQGDRDIKKVITSVTACQKLIYQAIAENADALVVHHGY